MIDKFKISYTQFSVINVAVIILYRQYFYSYLVFIALCTTIGCYFLYLVYCEEGWSLIVIISLPMAMFFTAMADGLCFFTVSFAFLCNMASSDPKAFLRSINFMTLLCFRSGLSYLKAM